MVENANLDTPLQKRKIIIASSAKLAPRLSNGLKNLGAEVNILPVIAVRGIHDSSDLNDSIVKLNQYDWIIFTSSYGVDFYLRYLIRKGLSNQELIGRNICAVGPSTAASLNDWGIPVTLIPKDFVGEGILSSLSDRYGGEAGLSGLRILIPRAKIARNLLPSELARVGAHVDVVACYESILPELTEFDRNSILESRPDLIVFTSSATVSNFLKLLSPDKGKELLACTSVAVLGPITAETTASYGKKADIIPAKSTVADLIEAILTYFK